MPGIYDSLLTLRGSSGCISPQHLDILLPIPWAFLHSFPGLEGGQCNLLHMALQHSEYTDTGLGTGIIPVTVSIRSNPVLGAYLKLPMYGCLPNLVAGLLIALIPRMYEA